MWWRWSHLRCEFGTVSRFLRTIVCKGTDKKNNGMTTMCLTGRHHGLSSGSQLDQVSSHSLVQTWSLLAPKNPNGHSQLQNKQSTIQWVTSQWVGAWSETPFQRGNFWKQPCDIHTAVCQVRKRWENFYHSLVSVAFHATQPRATQWLPSRTDCLRVWTPWSTHLYYCVSLPYLTVGLSLRVLPPTTAINSLLSKSADFTLLALLRFWIFLSYTMPATVPVFSSKWTHEHKLSALMSATLGLS